MKKRILQISIIVVLAIFCWSVTYAGWLSGYAYRKKCSVNGTVSGNQTDYQMKLIVGESSGASGEDVDCASHCQSFPDDVRFTSADGTTEHDYWIETGSISGTTPNRKATAWIEAASIPNPGPIDLYMYYGKTSDFGDSNGSTSFTFFDDFLSAGAGGWDKDIDGAPEHPLIKDGILYFPGSTSGLWILELDGTEKHHYLNGDNIQCSPVVIGSYVYSWEHNSGSPGEGNRLHKTKISDGTDTEVAGTRVDYECLSSANVSGTDVIFIPKNERVTAIKASDLSTLWTSVVVVEGGTGDLCHWDGGLVLGDYLYTRQVKVGDHKLFKLNLSNGTAADNVTITGEPYYSTLMYDVDNSQIIVTEKDTVKVKAFDKDDFTLNWTKVLDETSNWWIMRGCCYYNNRVYVADIDNNHTYSYIYCLNAVNGTQVWKSSIPYTNNVAVTNFLIDDNYLYCPTNSHTGHPNKGMLVIDISDGSLHDIIAMTGDSCCCTPVVSNGIIYLGTYYVVKDINARNLGSGDKMDCSYKCDSYYTGYIGNRLTSYSPDPDYTLTDKWVNSANFTLYNNMLEKYAANTNTKYSVTSKAQISEPLALETKVKVGSDWAAEYGWNFMLWWASGWATTGFGGGHYKDGSEDSNWLLRYSGGPPATDSNSTAESIIADTWYRLSLLIGATAQDYEVGSSHKLNLSTVPPVGSTNVTLSTVRASGTSDYTTYFDWVFARKYTSPEPLWGSWGSEVAAGLVSLKSVNSVVIEDIKSINDIAIGSMKSINGIE